MRLMNPNRKLEQTKKITLSGQNAKGAPTITFEVKTSNNWKDMIDLVTDCHTAIQDQTNESNKGTVQFKFSHVLTQIANIKVKPDVNLGTDTKNFCNGIKVRSRKYNTLQQGCL